MDAITEIELGVDDRGCTVLRRSHCEVPMLARVIDETGPALVLMLVNGAAGPLGGDRLRFRLVVGPGANVEVRSVAAALAQPGPRGGRSSLEIDLVVGDRATLTWRPQPTVSVMASDHRTTMRLEASASSTVSVSEAISLGRVDEPPGRLALHQRVTIDGESVLDHETVFAPGALLGAGAQGPHRRVTSEIWVGSSLPPAAVHVSRPCSTATFHLSPHCALSVVVAGPDACPSCRSSPRG